MTTAAADPACIRCMFARFAKMGGLCRRYPAPVEVTAGHWCGEYAPHDAAEESAGAAAELRAELARMEAREPAPGTPEHLARRLRRRQIAARLAELEQQEAGSGVATGQDG